MLIHQLLPAGYGVHEACQSRSFCTSPQPLLDHLAQPPCSTLQSSSHTEMLSSELHLQDFVADPCHGIQKKYLKDNKHEIVEHSVGVNSCKDLNSCNGRHRGMDRTSNNSGDRNGCISKSDNLLPRSLLDVANVHRAQEIASEVHIASKLGCHHLHRAQLEEQTIEEALACIEGMADEPLPTYVFIPVLKKCRKEKELAPTKRIHLHMCKHGLECHGLLKNFLITIYVDSGFVDEAQRLVSQSKNIDQHSWNTLIKGYLDSGKSKKAFTLYKEMEGKFIPSRRYILMALLQTFASQQCLEECQELHAKIVERKLESDRFFCNTLIDMYVRCGSFDDAKEVFNEHPCKDIVLFSTLITGLTDRGHFEDALRCWDQVVVEGLDPDVPTLVCGLKSCASIQDLNKGCEIHTSAVKAMLEENIVVGNSLVDMYAKCGALSDSQAVFDKLPVRNVVSWSALIAGYADYGFGEKALRRYDQMQLSGVIPNDVTFLGALKACVCIGSLKKGQELHAEIVAEEYEGYPLVSSTLMDMYSKFGLIYEARFLFSLLPIRNVIAWTALMEAYAEHGLYGKAFRCFKQMQSQGVLPNRVTFLCILKACCGRQMIGRGRGLHCEITMKGLEGDLLIGSALVHMYAQCGYPSDAQFIFDRLPNQCVISWTAIIGGYVKHGHGQEAICCFQQLKEEGALPEPATYLYMLKTCSDKESLELGQTIHTEVVCRGFEKQDRISSVLVYMYAKNALLAEAQNVFGSFHNRDTASWNVLTRSYVEQGLFETALAYLNRMEMENVLPEVTTWLLCMKACQCPGLLHKVYDLHSRILKQGLETYPPMEHCIANTYAFHGSFEYATVMFDRLPDCDPS
ncbi:hypothetical protein GOP47_0008956 [Adiantum capillus-veneris]|uniref:Pentatricopeptide repeat-containing protein n=1 Tax=Adiantum capillus-veneris TaxID=13818 RepID=A0A9D4UZA7_ADICA|nr:hypothetical protein GOP47_0008956 [Adiantum capillus-veneris]